VINAPIEKVDIADWLFKLSVAEYQRCCPPDHIACGATSTDDGKPMSIHVEMIGRTLMIQHYVAETATPTFCRMVSVSDAFMPNGRTRVQVIWTLGVKRIDDESCEYTNSVAAHPTAQFMKFIAEHKISFENAVVAPKGLAGTITVARRRSLPPASSAKRARPRIDHGLLSRERTAASSAVRPGGSDGLVSCAISRINAPLR
jgi:hypothetical protein